MAKTEVLGIVPPAEEMRKLLKPMHPKLVNENGKPAEFIFFSDMHSVCSVNPRVRLKNVGKEMIEAIDVEVEEVSVMPVGGKEPPLVPDPNRPGKPGLLAYKPNLSPSLREKCALSEKVKPGDEALVPFWRPLIQAMLKAQKVKGKGAGDKYHGGFDVRCYVRGVGMPAFDRTEGLPIPLGFTWSAKGFSVEMLNTLAETPTLATVVTAGDRIR